MTNCPNCGAPIVKSICEYCGTQFKTAEPAINYDLYINYKEIGGNGMYDRVIRNGLESGIFTLNEARRLLGYPRI